MNLSPGKQYLRKLGVQEQEGYQSFWESSDETDQDEKTLTIHASLQRLFDLSVSTIYVRRAYKDLDAIIQELYTSQTRCSYVLLTGTPGVGKTLFLLYELYMARGRRRTVVMQVGSRPAIAFIRDADTTIVVPSCGEEKYTLLNNPQVLYFFDPDGTTGGVTESVAAFTIVFASTYGGNIGVLKKQHFDKLYMPVWSFKEMEECRSMCYPEKTAESVKEGYEIWGGSPRCIFTTPHHQNETRLQTFLTSDSVEDSLADMDGIMRRADTYKAHQWLTHISVEGQSYRVPCFHWPSSYIRKEVKRVLVLHNKEAIRRLLARSPNSTGTGHLFEDISFDLLREHDETLEALRVCGNEKLEIKKPVHIDFFGNKDEFTLSNFEDDTFMAPLEPNKESIDYVQTPNLLFQPTIKETHPIKANGLNMVAEQFGQTQWNFVFCLPVSRFSTWREQRITGQLNPDIKIEQFKLLITI